MVGPASLASDGHVPFSQTEKTGRAMLYDTVSPTTTTTGIQCMLARVLRAKSTPAPLHRVFHVPNQAPPCHGAGKLSIVAAVTASRG
jgi:hypothetical protein